MHKAFKLLLLSVLLSACAQISEVDIQATEKAFRNTEAVGTAYAKTAVANATVYAFATKAAALPPIWQLDVVCQGQSVPEAATYSTSSSIHPVYISGGLARLFEKGLPSGWSSKLISDTQLVVCLPHTVDLEVIEVCNYGLASGISQVKIARYKATLIARLVEAKTGKLIDEESFQKTARGCPSGTAQTFDGDYLPNDFEFNDIENWLERFVSP